MRVTRPVGSGPGSAVKKRIARGCAKRGSASVVGHVLGECLQQCDLDEIHADCVAHEIGHLAAGNPSSDLDDGDAAVGRGDELRERDGVGEAERAHRLDGDLPGEAQLLGRDRRRVDVDPADAEADSGRAEAVAQRDQRGLADPRDHDAVQLDAVDELLEERLVGRRLGDRLRRGRARAPRATRCGRPRAGRPSRPASGRPGKRTFSSAASISSAERRLAYGGCGRPAAPRASRIARLCVRR